jgi:hypothetical protein
VLRIVPELHHVEAAVVALAEMSLRASPHFADETAGVDRHEVP